MANTIFTSTGLLGSLQVIRTSMDDADATPFGQMGKLLDRVTVETERAIAIAQHLEGGESEIKAAAVKLLHEYDQHYGVDDGIGNLPGDIVEAVQALRSAVRQAARP